MIETVNDGRCKLSKCGPCIVATNQKGSTVRRSASTRATKQHNKRRQASAMEVRARLPRAASRGWQAWQMAMWHSLRPKPRLPYIITEQFLDTYSIVRDIGKVYNVD